MTAPTLYSSLVTFFSMAGAIILAALSLAVMAMSIGWAAFHVKRVRDRRDELVRSLYARQFGRELWSSAWWFPSPDVKRVLQLIGISMQMHGTYDVEQIREKWKQGDEAEVQDLGRVGDDVERGTARESD
jgi:hypothetical protein